MSETTSGADQFHFEMVTEDGDHIEIFAPNGGRPEVSWSGPGIGTLTVTDLSELIGRLIEAHNRITGPDGHKLGLLESIEEGEDDAW